MEKITPLTDLPQWHPSSLEPELSPMESSCSSADEADEAIFTLNDLLLQRARDSPDAPLVGYPEQGAAQYSYYSATDLLRFGGGAAKDLKVQGLPENDSSLGAEDKIVALLGPSNLDYVASIFALTQMGYGILLLSTRLAIEAYVSLLEKTKCNHILTIGSSTKTIAAIQAVRPCNSYSIPKKSAYDVPRQARLEKAARSGPHMLNRIAFIIHSSGSTGLPKPIFQTHKACLSNYANGSGYRAFLTLPLYHNHGLSTFWRSIYKSKPISLYSSSLPLSESNLVAAMEASKPESFHGVPYALKLLSETERGIAALQKCKLVLFGGSSCPDDLGDKLVNAGVYVVSHYGATEMGQLMTSFREPGDKAWNYVRPFPAIAPFLSMVPQGDGSSECVCLDGLPAKVASNCSEPPNSFRTSDTFLPHPTIPNAWKYLGRIDDRVTLVNGEKVLPVPMEHQVRQNEYAKEVLIFGIGQAFPGILIIPSEKTVGLDKSQILEKIWPSIEAANSRAEAFSQIQKEMVEILEVDTVYPSTDKGTIIRVASYRRFASVIDSVYARFENGASSSGKKLSLNLEDLKEFLLKFFTVEVGIEGLRADMDLFDCGVDSLQALKARAYFKRELNIGGSDLDQNVVFEHPSVAKLAAHLQSLRTGEAAEAEDEIEAMAELIEKYSKFKKHVVPQQQQVVLLTGTTGSLGAHVLSQLLHNDAVSKVYCLVRASSPAAALDRILSTLASKRLVPFKNTHKIVALPANLGQADLGLAPNHIHDLKQSLTKVIHSAWAVNFNLQIRSFESQHISGVSNLINLCLSVVAPQPAHFFFCSSISAAAGTPLPATIEEGPVPHLEHAQNMGYARSKLVAERIVQAAAAQTGMVAKVLRVGQIVGDSAAGIWNTTEAIPLMIQSAVTMGVLPTLDETPSWLPVDIVAKTILDLAHLNANTNPTTTESSHHLSPSSLSSSSNLNLHDPNLIYHIQNPRSFHWTSDLLPALSAAGLEFRVVPQREWIRVLRDESDPDPTRNPTRKLLEFFEDKYDNDRMGRKGLRFLTVRTEGESPTLRGGVDIIGSGLVQKMVREWMKAWKKGE